MNSGLGFVSTNNYENLFGSMYDNGHLLDSEGFAIYSNVKFLYLIGKIASETGVEPEDALNAL